jgi:protein SCO1/2
MSNEHKSIGRRHLLLAGAAALAACKTPTAPRGAEKRYSLRGTIVQLKPNEKIAKIKHEKIEGWMDAMTMEFPVPEAAEFQKLKEGEVIEATVVVQDLDYHLTAIREIALPK